MRRKLYFISLIFILIVAISVYGPYDFLGAYAKADAVHLALTDGEHVQATGKISRKEIKNDQTVYYIQDAELICEKGQLKNISFIFKLDSDHIPNKSKVNIEGTASLFSPGRNEGSFDMEKYYYSMEYFFEVKDARVSSGDGECFLFEGLCRLSNRLLYVYEKCLPGEEAGFIASVVIGNKSDLAKELRSLFQLVGIAHILAVSGLHVSVVCMAFYRFLRKRGLSFVCSGVAAGVVAISYGLLTGGSISSIRAIGMFLIFLLGDIAGESYDSLTAMAVMADILVISNPLVLLNGSFLFSFGAVLGINYITMPLSKRYGLITRETIRLRHYDNGLLLKVWHYLAASFVFSFSISVAMLPLVTNLYYETPLFSVLLNLLVLPLMPVLLFLGILGGFSGLFWLPAAKVLLLPCHIIIYGFEMLADFVVQLPFSRIVVGHRSLWKVVVYYVILLGIIYWEEIGNYLNIVNSFLNDCINNDESKLIEIKNEDSFSNRKICIKLESLNINPRMKQFHRKKRLSVILACMLLLQIIWFAPSKGNFEMDFLDVGQGDGIFINSGDGVTFFIDGGSSSSDGVGQYTIEPFLKYKGIRHIDYWFVSHTDSDHISGLKYLLQEGYDIDNLVFAEAFNGIKDEALEELIQLSASNGTNICYMKKGGVIGSKHLAFKCVNSTNVAAALKDIDANALSLCLLLECDFDTDGKCDYSAFFGGDIAAEQEKMLVDSGMVSHVDLLKVSHHGSKYSSDEKFLAVLSPDIAIISCSKRNMYGHPAPEAVERLEAAGAKVYYTMDSGRVRARAGEVDVYVE